MPVVLRVALSTMVPVVDEPLKQVFVGVNFTPAHGGKLLSAAMRSTVYVHRFEVYKPVAMKGFSDGTSVRSSKQMASQVTGGVHVLQTCQVKVVVPATAGWAEIISHALQMHSLPQLASETCVALVGHWSPMLAGTEADGVAETEGEEVGGPVVLTMATSHQPDWLTGTFTSLGPAGSTRMVM